MAEGKIIVLWFVGALAGTLAGRLMTFSKESLGKWTNVGIGTLGAVVGRFHFGLFEFDFGLGATKVSFEDLIAAFVGSLLCIVVWWLIHKYSDSKARSEQ